MSHNEADLSIPDSAKSPKSVRFAADPPSHSAQEATLFSIDDDDDEYGTPYSSAPEAPSQSSQTSMASAGQPSSAQSSTTRSTYGLKSTIPSREAEFDADASDILSDDEAAAAAFDETGADTSSRRNLLGSSAHARRSFSSLPLPSGLRQSVDGFGGNLAELRRNVMEGLEGVGEATGFTENGELPDWLKRGAGVFEATTNMANSILGAGIVGLPYSMRQSGFVAGVALLVGLAMLTDWTIRLIILNSKLSGRTTYIEIMEHCFGKQGKAAVSLFQFAFAFGGMCAFCVVIGDTIPHVLSSIVPSLAPGASAFSFLASRGFVITFCTVTISYPLSLYRSIENLSKASAVALVSMVLIVGTVIVRGPAMPAELKGDSSLRFTLVDPKNIVSSISVISFAFVCHHNSLLIYASLKEPSMDKFGKVTHYSTAIACAALTAMSVAGYWTFTDKTLGNILNNFPEKDTFVNIARFAFGVNMFTTFPLEAFVCREVLETYFFENQYSTKLHVIITTSLTLAALIISLLTCDLGIVLELTGGLSATALAFIFPALCFLKLTAEGSSKSFSISGLGRGIAQSWSGNGSGSNAGSGGSGNRGANGQYQPVSSSADDDREDEGNDSLDNLESAQGIHRGSEHNAPRESVGDISVDEVELPLRPGAQIRARAPGDGKSWWLSTKPVAVLCAIFGTVVLIISVCQALATFLTSSDRGAVHTC
ncbi:unnamed protein product [Sympodiomycopsis kandeliae]